MLVDKNLLFLPSRLESSAWTGHLPFAAWLMQTMKPDVFVELGTHYGNSYFTFCQAAARAQLTTKCYAVDIWEREGNYTEPVFQGVDEHNIQYQAFSKLLRMDFTEALTHFQDKSIDLLHIDGNHTYKAVHHDYVSWKPKLTKRAIVLFHDVAIRDRDFGVWRLWEELTKQYPGFYFPHCNGLGVLFMDAAAPNKEVRSFLLNRSATEIAEIQGYFDKLGTELQRTKTLTLD